MKPVLVEEDKLMGKKYTHPAFGMISYGRVSGGTNLVGSELFHNHFIKLEIESARQYRNLHEDRFYADKTITEVWLSEQQWATFIASPNTEGVPCTIRHRPDPTAKLIVVPPVEDENKHDLAKKELTEYGKEIVEDLRKSVKTLSALLDNPTIKKSDLKKSIQSLDAVVMYITQNIPFHIEQHKELMEKNLMAAKSDIEGYLTGVIYGLGLEKLKEIAPRLEQKQLEDN